MAKMHFINTLRINSNILSNTNYSQIQNKKTNPVACEKNSNPNEIRVEKALKRTYISFGIELPYKKQHHVSAH